MSKGLMKNKLVRKCFINDKRKLKKVKMKEEGPFRTTKFNIFMHYIRIHLKGLNGIQWNLAPPLEGNNGKAIPFMHANSSLSDT